MSTLLISLLEASPEKITYPYQYSLTGKVEEVNHLTDTLNDAVTFEGFSVVEGALTKTVTVDITSHETLHALLESEREHVLAQIKTPGNKRNLLNRFIIKPDTSNGSAIIRVNAEYRKYLDLYPVTVAAEQTTTRAQSVTSTKTTASEHPIVHTVR